VTEAAAEESERGGVRNKKSNDGEIRLGGVDAWMIQKTSHELRRMARNSVIIVWQCIRRSGTETKLSSPTSHELTAPFCL